MLSKFPQDSIENLRYVSCVHPVSKIQITILQNGEILNIILMIIIILTTTAAIINKKKYM